MSQNVLCYDYQYGLASMLYAKLTLANIELANKLHNTKGFKFYTFSHLILDDRIVANNGLAFTKAHFFLSSPDTEFIKSVAEGLLMQPEFFLKNEGSVTYFVIEDVEILPSIEFSDTCTFKTISPVYLKTLRNRVVNNNDERLVETDLYPTDFKFYENLHKNLVSRYEAFYKLKLDKDFFDVLDIDYFKPKRVKIEKNYRRCSLMDIQIYANPELIKFAYDAGLGEKNAMGFGCVDVIK